MRILGIKVKFGADTRQYKSATRKAGGFTKKLSNQVKKLGGMIVAAFAVRAIINFTKEIIGLAGKAEGVRAAFQKLNNPLLLKNLRDATRGTVSDLELMKLAVQANNFKIPLGKLATFFEFATKRSAETGESVDYLVNSIITGIGRKSVLVMDNLGISAVELQEEVKKVGDFGLAAGNIIEREIGKMGDVAKTTAQDVASINAQWENFKERVGEALIVTGDLKKLLEKTALVMEKLMNIEGATKGSNIAETVLGSISDWDKGDQLSFLARKISDIKQEAKRLKKIIDDKTLISLFGGRLKIGRIGERQSDIIGKTTKELNALNAQLKIYKDFMSAPLATPGKPPPLPPTSHTKAGTTAPISPIFNTDMGLSGLGELPLKIRETAEALKEPLNQMTQLMQESFQAMAVSVGESIGDMISGLSSFDDFGKRLLGMVGEFAGKFGAFMIAYAISMMEFQKGLKGNWQLMLAAGIALVVFGSVIRNIASKGVGGGGGSASGGSALASSQTIEIKGMISGRDIKLVNRRNG